MDLAHVRDALRKRKIADKARLAAKAAEEVAREAERRIGLDPRSLAIARGGTRKRHPAHEAILKKGITVEIAAALCGTTGPVLSKAWATGGQLRPARPKWRRTLARLGVPLEAWPDKPIHM